MIPTLPVQLRDYQLRAIQAIHDYYAVRDGNCVIVAPTGSGKSIIIGGFCCEVIRTWPHQRIIILSHQRELLAQDFEAIRRIWPDAPIGLYSAGLGKRQPRNSITVAGIQSAFRKPNAFGWRDLCLIDECHLLAPDSNTMYRRFIGGLKQINPKLKCIGFTASPYRLKTGMLTEGKDALFQDIAFEISVRELLDAGYICPMIGKSSVVQADLAGVRITAGEYNSGDLEKAMDKELLTRAALDEVFALAADRKSWLVFCSGVKHAEHVCEAIRSRGVTAACVTGDTPTGERDEILRAFKAGELRAAVSVGVLTTGFDAPNVDCIVLLRPTTSPGLFLQMAGRGLRIAPGKANCLLLDYAGCLEHHGMIDNIRPPRPATSRGNRVERVERTCLICPKCRMASPMGAKECADCGHSFERPEVVKHGTSASPLQVMSAAGPVNEPEWVEVESVRYTRHEKEGKIPSLRVEYTAGLRKMSEWVCLMHPPGFALGKARDWWKARSSLPPPEDLGTAVMLAAGLKTPRRIRVKQDGKWWKVIGYDFSEREDGPWPCEYGPSAEDAPADSGYSAA